MSMLCVSCRGSMTSLPSEVLEIIANNLQCNDKVCPLPVSTQQFIGSAVCGYEQFSTACAGQPGIVL